LKAVTLPPGVTTEPVCTDHCRYLEQKNVARKSHGDHLQGRVEAYNDKQPPWPLVHKRTIPTE
jgi:hypothetical protein